jgi:hypothetical protein
LCDPYFRYVFLELIQKAIIFYQSHWKVLQKRLAKNKKTVSSFDPVSSSNSSSSEVSDYTLDPFVIDSDLHTTSETPSSPSPTIFKMYSQIISELSRVFVHFASDNVGVNIVPPALIHKDANGEFGGLTRRSLPTHIHHVPDIPPLMFVPPPPNSSLLEKSLSLFSAPLIRGDSKIDISKFTPSMLNSFGIFDHNILSTNEYGFI